MFLLVLLAAGLVAVPVLGGRLSALLSLHFRGVLLLQLAVLTQVLIIYVFEGTGVVPVQRGVHLATYAATGMFVYLNRHIPGMKMLGLGGAANMAAITANAGVMPTLPGAAAVAGLHSTTEGFQNSAVSTGSPLWFLGDVFAIPAGIPLANVFSVGDVLLLAAGWLMIWAATGSTIALPRRREVLPA